MIVREQFLNVCAARAVVDGGRERQALNQY